MHIRHFYILSLFSVFAWEASAAGRLEARPKLSPSHMHYFKACFAHERGDIQKAKNELRLAQVLDENSPYLRLAMQRQRTQHEKARLPKAMPSERFRGELSSARVEERHFQETVHLSKE
ncbi:MAG: hypothetical protein FWG75_02250 [Cystobacterineae bacterium]|nr:hypothetical protein [Cystobacterineae bacterium]